MAIPGLKVVAPSTPGRRRRADGVGDPRRRPGDLLRAQGAVRDQGRRARRRPRRAARSGRGRARRRRLHDRRARGDGPAGRRGRRAAARGARDRRRGHRPALPRAARRRRRSSTRSPRRAACSRSRRTRGCWAGAPRSCRSSPTRGSGASTRRSGGSRRRTSRCRPRRRSRISRSRAWTGSSTRSVAGWRRRGDATAGAPASTVGLVGTGRMGSAMARALAARRPAARRSTTAAASGAQALADELGARGRREPRPTSPRPRTSRSRCSPTTPRWPRSTAARDGLLAGRASGSRARRPEHGDARRAAGLRGRGRARPASGCSIRPVSGSTALAESGQLTLMVGGEAARPRARPARPGAAGQGDLPPRAAGHRRGDEARRQHRDLRAQRGPLRGRWSWRSWPGSTASAAYDVLAASAVGAPYVGYKRAAFLDPDGDAGRRSRSTSRRRTCG